METDTPSEFYVLIDNRIDGPAGTLGSPNSTDPVLGGILQWVLDGGWVRMNSGSSPGGLPDYTGVDEGGDSVGPGLGLNQFYSIYKFPTIGTNATVSNPGVNGGNMISLVVIPLPDTNEPITSFSNSPITISEGDPANLNWIIHPDATAGTIDQALGDILPLTTDGKGTAPVTPAVTLSSPEIL